MEDNPLEDDVSERELREEFRQLGLWPLKFQESDDEPEVDLDALRRLAQKALPPSAMKLLYQFVARYRSWYEAYVEILTNKDY